MQQVERAIFDLRRGLPVVVCEEGDQPGEAVMIYPIESIGDADVAEIFETTGSSPVLTLTRHRMEAMGFSAHSGAASLPIKGGDGLSAESLYCAAATAGRVRSDLFDEPRPAAPAERAALALMRRALLVPAVLSARIDSSRQVAVERALADGSILRVPARLAEHCFESGVGMLRRVSEADVPLSEAVRSRFVLFREPDGLREHVAVLIGEAAEWADEVPVRLHSACLTGDLFGSLRCDCGEQLKNGVQAIAELGGGVLLYLAQEGRGIGLANKLRAYELQDAGLDTVEADRVLGFGDDNRRYRVAVDILSDLSIARVRLLTNNPAKVRALREGGVDVAAREGLYGRVTPQNRRYLKVKASRSGHLLDELLDE